MSRGKWRRWHTDTRISENFTKRGLSDLTGQPPHYWGGYCLKELLDNSIEAAESAGLRPTLEVHIEGVHTSAPGSPFACETIEVRDEGPGIGETRVQKIFGRLNEFGGTKKHYNLPTRGNQGNALMTILGIQNLAGGSLVVTSGGKRHEISVEEEKISGKPRAEINTSAAKADAEGTEVSLDLSGTNFGNGERVEKILGEFIALNPHASFDIAIDLGQAGTIEYESPAVDDHTVNQFSLSKGSIKGKPNWFSFDNFKELLRADARADPDLTVAEFVSEFAKVGGKRKEAIIDALDCRGESVYDLASGDDARVRELYDELREVSDPYTEQGLGEKIGSVGPSLKEGLIEYLDFNGWKAGLEDLVDDLDGFESLRDLCVYYGGGGIASGEEKDMPHYFEVAAVPKNVRDGSLGPSSSTVVFGINQSVTYSTPRVDLSVKHKGKGKKRHRKIGAAFDKAGHPYFVLVNLTCPNITFQDKGKQNFDPTPFKPAMAEVVGKAVRKIERDIRPRLNDLRSEPDPGPSRAEQEFKRKKAPKGFIREFVHDNFWNVYNEATDHGEHILTMQQFFYKMRPKFREEAERKGYEYSPNASFDGKPENRMKKLEFKKSTFRQKVDEFEKKIGRRVIYRDDRGFFVEPHTNRQIELGTKAVKNYDPPEKEFGNLLYVEKTGFFELLHKDFELTKKYDIGLINAKGNTVNAGRDLVEKIQRECDGVNLYILTDLDIKGIGIAEDAEKPDDLSSLDERFDAERIGVTLEDVEKYDLPIEQREYKDSTKSELKNMREREEVSEELYEFFMRNGGQAVEINAFSPVELEGYLIDKFEEHGIEKVRPDEEDIREPEVETPEKVRERALREAVGSFVMERAGGNLAEELREIGIETGSSLADDLEDLAQRDSRDVLEDVCEELEKFPAKGWRKIRDEKLKETESEGEKKSEKLENAYRAEVLDFLRRYAFADAEIEGKELRRLRRMVSENSEDNREEIQNA